VDPATFDVVTTTTISPRRRPLGLRPDQRAGIGAGVALLLLLFGSTLVPDPPPTVRQVTIVNPHSWQANVAVGRTGSDPGWIPVATPNRASTFTTHDVIDQGPTWLIRFSYAGLQTTATVARADLARSNWIIRVPDQFADALSAAGVAPSSDG
jgi:hypothetical protein